MSLKNIQSLLTEQPNSGSSAPDRAFSIVNTTRIYKFAPIYRETILNELEQLDLGLNESDGYLMSWSHASAIGYHELTCNFCTSSNAQGGGSKPVPNKPKFYREFNQDNTPLEQIDGYLTNWIYDLAAKEGVLENSVSHNLWITATTVALSNDQAKDYRWLKDTSQLPDGWYLMYEKTKKGAIEKINSNAVIREEVWTETEKRAIEYAIDSTQLKTPSKTLGITGGAWLAMPSSIVPDGELFLITTTFLHAQTWDSDIYA